MVDESLKEWVRKKREAGVSDERIKKSLEDTGHDPSIVDELDNPFDGDSDKEVSEDPFQSSDAGADAENVPETEDQESTDESPGNYFDSSSGSSSSGDSGSSGQESSIIEMPDFDFSVPDTGNVGKRKIAVFAAVLILVAGGYAVFSSGVVYQDIFAPDQVSGDDSASLAELEASYSGCPNAGVRINSLSASNGQTTANVLVTRNEANVVLEIRQDGNLVGFTTDKVEGESQMSVEAVGDTAILRPLGCDDFSSERSY